MVEVLLQHQALVDETDQVPRLSIVALVIVSLSMKEVNSQSFFSFIKSYHFKPQ